MASSVPSPYSGHLQSEWLNITRRLVKAHPLKPNQILEIAESVWTSLWKSTIGSGQNRTPLKSLVVPSTVVGYLFETLFAKELNQRTKGVWRGARAGAEKVLVYTPNARFSIELKTSGQLGSKVFGNRSYGQKRSPESREKKEKSGYYITVNFYRHAMALIRFGWIDAVDWSPQLAPTGQMAGLSDAVYQLKLLEIVGPYQLSGPVELLGGIGPRRAAELRAKGIVTIGDLMRHSSPLPDSLDALRSGLRRKYAAPDR